MIDPQPPIASSPPPPPSNRRFIAILALMSIAFIGVLVYRSRIRCEWWAHRLAAAASPADPSYYVSCLMACGEDALPAIRRLARDRRPEIRGIALVLLARLPMDTIVNNISPLLHDPDRDLRESAGMTLAFSAAPPAIALLCDTAAAPDEQVACAALASLARTSDPKALAALCDALARRPQALVRAQAAESLAETINPAPGINQPSGIPTNPCDPIAALVHALADNDPFDGTLATERQINQVAAHVATQTTRPVSRPAGQPGARTVASIAAAGLSRLTGTEVPAEPVADEKAASLQFRFLIQRRNEH